MMQLLGSKGLSGYVDGTIMLDQRLEPLFQIPLQFTLLFQVLMNGITVINLLEDISHSTALMLLDWKSK